MAPALFDHSNWPPGPRRFAVLTGHFFKRFFRNDLIDFEHQAQGSMIAILAMLSVLLGWIALLLLGKYSLFADDNISWREKTTLINLQMTVFAIFVLLQWEAIYPDRRDYFNLRHLPLSTAGIFLAKTSACLLFIALFALSTGALTAIMLPMFLADWVSSSLLFSLRYTLAYLLVIFLASALVFFSLVALRSLAMLLFHRIFSAGGLSLLRFALLSVFFGLLLIFLLAPDQVEGFFWGGGSKELFAASWMHFFPPLWFTALLEVMLGNPDPLFAGLAPLALWSLPVALFLFLAGGLSAYRFESGRILEQSGGGKPAWLVRLGAPVRMVFSRLFLGRAEERAVFFFVTANLRANKGYRLRLLAAFSLAVGLVVAFAMLNELWLDSFTPINRKFIGLPLFVSLALVAAYRYLADMPVAINANWIFQLTESQNRHSYIAGAKKAALFRLLLPFWLIIFCLHLPLWPVLTALSHALFGLLLSLALLEILFRRSRKIPFTCTLVPGRLRLQFFGVVYLSGSIAGLFLLTLLERALLADPKAMAFFLIFLLLLMALLRWRQKIYLKANAFIFEEFPEPAMVSFPEDLQMLKRP